MEHDVVTRGKNISRRVLFGRKKVTCSFDEINDSNVVKALNEAMAIHNKNRDEIEYLFNYYRGDQPILYRQKTVRPDLTDNIVVNRASEIVAFKVSYLLSEPVAYISRHDGETNAIEQLNDWMYMADKDAQDKELADDFTICGVANRLVYPVADENSDVPFKIRSLNPMNSFVCYKQSAYKNSPKLFGVTYVERDGVGTVYDVYTDDAHYTIIGNEVAEKEANLLHRVPIIEYLNNEFRLGAFEQVLSLMDGLNTLASNRVEATEQNVQSLTWFNDVELDDDQVDRLKENSSAFVFTKTVPGSTSPTIKNILVDLQQSDQQVLSNDLYRTILQIVGMPVTGDGNTSDSSNNGSTIVRNGWQHAEARAKDTATMWERSDKETLAIILDICRRIKGGFDLNVSDIGIRFTRRNYEDIMTKTTVLTTLLGCNWVDPKDAYVISDIVSDPERAYSNAVAFHKQALAEQMEQAGQMAALTASANTGNEGGSEDAE